MKIQDILIERPSSDKVNDTIYNQKKWKHLGQGAAGSVWTHADDPDTVVKVVGGGDYDLDNLEPSERRSAIAFLDFCVHEGLRTHPGDEWRKHYPNILDANVQYTPTTGVRFPDMENHKSNEVLQIRIERLYPFKNRNLPVLLGRYARLVSNKQGDYYIEGTLQRMIKNTPNTMESLARAITLLSTALRPYGKKHKCNPTLDLHEGNWLQRQDGTIVAADPWF